MFECKSQISQKLSISRLPLAVYLEIVAHVRQLEGVEAEVITNWVSTQSVFDYRASQAAGIQLKCLEDLTVETQAQLEAILHHYQQIHGIWQRENI